MLGDKYINILGGSLNEKSNSVGGGSKESAVLPQLGLVQNSQKILECDLKRKQKKKKNVNRKPPKRYICKQ